MASRKFSSNKIETNRKVSSNKIDAQKFNKIDTQKKKKDNDDELNIGDLKISRMVETPVTTSAGRSQNADILMRAGDTLIEDVNKELSEDPMFQYDLVVEQEHAFFNKQEGDDGLILNMEMQRCNKIMKHGHKLHPNKALIYYFQNMPSPLALDDNTKSQIMKIFKAVQDVFREGKPGNIIDKLTSGRQMNYDMVEYNLARTIYEKMIENDIKAGAVTIDILKLARDPKSAIVDLVEKKDMPKAKKLGTFDIGGLSDNDELEIDREKEGDLIKDIRDQIGRGGAAFNKQTLKHLAMSKAITTKDDEQIQHLVSGHLNEQHLTDYVTSGQSDWSEIHKIYQNGLHRDDFAELLAQEFEDIVMPMPEKRKTPMGTYSAAMAKKALIDQSDVKEILTPNEQERITQNQENWKADDGMTHSIMSFEEEKDEMTKIKLGKYSTDKRPSDEPEDPKAKIKQIIELVDNIDSIAEKAKNIKLTKNDFIDCLRQVTQIKIMSIKESKEIFEKRIQKLIKAQEYELTNQEQQAIRTAQEVFIQQGQYMIQLFDKEAHLLQGQYQEIDALIRHYTKNVNTICHQVATQEIVIQRLQEYISQHLLRQVDRRVAYKSAIQKFQVAQIPFNLVRVELPNVQDRAFDFFGGSVRLESNDMHYFFDNVLLKEKQNELDQLKNEIRVVNNQVEEVQDLLAVTTKNETQLKIDKFEMGNQLVRLKNQHEYELEQAEVVRVKETKDLKEKIKSLVELDQDAKRYSEFELKTKDAIIDIYQKRCDILNDNAKKMKACLRIPRLTKQYHDMTRDEHIPEFDAIEEIYEKHFQMTNEEKRELLKADKESPERVLSIVEKKAMDSVANPPELNLNSAGGLNRLENISYMQVRGAKELFGGWQKKDSLKNNRLMTQADNRAIRKLSNLRNSVANTTLEPITDSKYIQVKQQRPTAMKDGSMNETQMFNLNMKYKGLEQYLDESLTKRTRASHDFQGKEGQSWMPRNSKIESLNLAPGAKKMKKRAFHTTARASGGVGKANWMNSSMTVESSNDRKSKQKTKFMNEFINKSIDVPVFSYTNQNSLAEPNLIGQPLKLGGPSGQNTTVIERAMFGKLGGHIDSSVLQLGKFTTAKNIYAGALNSSRTDSSGERFNAYKNSPTRTLGKDSQEIMIKNHQPFILEQNPRNKGLKGKKQVNKKPINIQEITHGNHGPLVPPINNFASIHTTPMVRNTRYNNKNNFDSIQLDQNSTARNSVLKNMNNFETVGRELKTEMRTEVSNITGMAGYKNEIASQKMSKQRFTPSAIDSLNINSLQH